MSKRKKVKKQVNSKVEIWTEEQCEEYLADLYGMEYIAGFTEGGMPYGVFREDNDIFDEIFDVNENKSDNPRDFDDEIPF